MNAQRKDGEPVAKKHPPEHPTRAWKVLIVDDEPTVHQVTQLALADIQFSGRDLHFFNAYKASEAVTLLKANPDMALMLLDVVMETPDAGLQLVKQVREELKNQAVRIILRTGQPGQAPERRVVSDYDINDYKEKSELTATKLYTTVYSALRAYRDILALERNRKGLETVIQATATIFRSRDLGEFAQGVLEQLTALLYLAPDALYCKTEKAVTDSTEDSMEIIAATGCFSHLTGKSTDQIEESLAADAILSARRNKTHVLWKERVYAVYFRTESGYESVICVQSLENRTLRISGLVDLFLRNVSIAFDNISLQHDLSQEILVRRESERREAILARLPSELPDPVIRISTSGEVLYANAASKPILESMAGKVGARLPDL